MVSSLTAAVFTRERPVSKVELHNAFYRNGAYRDTPVVEARATIGLNAPKYLVREGYVTVQLRGGVDTYVITPEGREWLRAGIARFLELHPERVRDCTERPSTAPPAAPRRVRAGPPAMPSAPPQSRVIRRMRA